MTRAHMFFDGIGVGPIEVVFGLLMTALWIGFWVLIVMLIIRLVRRGGHHHHDRERGSAALDVLEERYARGEITREEFQERRAVLRGETA